MPPVASPLRIIQPALLYRVELGVCGRLFNPLTSAPVRGVGENRHVTHHGRRRIFGESIVGQLRLMAVHAHPDDESSKGAATMAKYVAEGVDVLVVTCTGGERGSVLNPKLDRPEVWANMSQLRHVEMQRAREILGVRQEWLGFVDSGLPEGDPLPPLPDLRPRLEAIIENPPLNSQIWWSRERRDYLLNQMSPRHRAQAEEMIRGPKTTYGTVFRRVRNDKTMAELRTDGIAGCLRTPRGGSARQILVQGGWRRFGRGTSEPLGLELSG